MGVYLQVDLVPYKMQKRNTFALKTQKARKKLLSAIKWNVVHPSARRTKQKSNFVAHQAYIEAALKKMKWTRMGTCKLYSCNFNRDNYPRIRYSVPGDYTLDTDGNVKIFKYKRAGKEATRKRLKDYRPYLHCYLYWKKDLLYKRNMRRRREKKEISHRCGKRNCGEVEHLCLEDHLSNLSRIGCPKDNRCNHKPPCI